MIIDLEELEGRWLTEKMRTFKEMVKAKKEVRLGADLFSVLVIIDQEEVESLMLAESISYKCGAKAFLDTKLDNNEMVETTVHDVKSWCYLFDAILKGQKKHEIRKMKDRDYRVGDILRLREFDQTQGGYTGRELPAKITYVTSCVTPCALSGGALHDDYCILSIEVIR